MLQYVAVCCAMVAVSVRNQVHCSLLQSVAVSCSVLRQVIGAKADVNVRTKVCMRGVGWWVGWVFATHSILQCVANTHPILLCYTHQTILHTAAHTKSLYMNCNNVQHTMTHSNTLLTQQQRTRTYRKSIAM